MISFSAILFVIALNVQPQLSSRNPIEIPIPKKDFSVMIVDSEDNKISLTGFSCNGEIYLNGAFGKADIAVSFEKIKIIEFNRVENDIFAVIKMKDQTETKIKVKKSLPFYGRTGYGNIIIKAEDITLIEFQ
ncbi:MAG TPA: hypothetical protein VII00_03370 [bacterium]